MNPLYIVVIVTSCCYAAPTEVIPASPDIENMTPVSKLILSTSQTTTKNSSSRSNDTCSCDLHKDRYEVECLLRGIVICICICILLVFIIIIVKWKTTKMEREKNKLPVVDTQYYPVEMNR